MEFWIGLSVGMHLGGVLARYIEKFAVAYGLLTEEGREEIEEIEAATREIGKIVEAAAED